MHGYHTYRMAKLVRDSSIANMTDKGTAVDWRRLDDSEMRAHLLAKLVEEAQEAAGSRNAAALADELADLLEIIRALIPLAGTTPDLVEAARLAKVAKRGDFSQRYYVDVIRCPVGSFWDEYCAKDPSKYPRAD